MAALEASVHPRQTRLPYTLALITPRTGVIHRYVKEGECCLQA